MRYVPSIVAVTLQQFDDAVKLQQEVSGEMRCYKCLRLLEKEGVHGLHPKCFLEWFGVDGTKVPFSLTMKTAGNSNDPLAHLNSSFFHGKFKKYSARLGNAGYIVKVCQEPFVELPSMEFLCNQIARLLKISIPDFYLIKLEGHTEAFISKNFMEKHSDANLVHFYRFMGDKAFNLENVIAVTLKETGSFLDVERFIKLCLFDMLIGNHDRHGRNLALIENPKGKFLSPFYDNPSCLGIEESWLLKAILEPCGKIHSSKSAEPKMSEYAIDFCELGHFSVVSDFFKLINVDQIQSQISDSFISDSRKQALSKLILRRYHELEKTVGFYGPSDG